MGVAYGDVGRRTPARSGAGGQELQRSWYGEPLGDLFRRLIADLGLNQARLAAVLGLSAPMLSQLMSGQRAKIGNPAVVQRLQSLQELAGQVADGQDRARWRRRPGWTRSGSRRASSVLGGTTTHSAGGTRRRARPPGGPRHPDRAAVGGRRRTRSNRPHGPSRPPTPQLAEFLRVYGAGRTGEAVGHYEAHQD